MAQLAIIQDQGRLTIELLRSLVTLLLPKEGASEGVPLEDLIAGMVAMQRELLAVARHTDAEVTKIGEALPPVVGNGAGNGASHRRMT
jgi:hypothetical protein